MSEKASEGGGKTGREVHIHVRTADTKSFAMRKVRKKDGAKTSGKNGDGSPANPRSRPFWLGERTATLLFALRMVLGAFGQRKVQNEK